MPGIAGIYSHPTPPMRTELMDALTGCWEKSPDERLALCATSPVPVLGGCSASGPRGVFLPGFSRTIFETSFGEAVSGL
jgi:hypothetical protein